MNSEKSFWEKYFQEQKKYKESKKHIMMVIAAIIREAGGVFRSKTILNKVIWKAHLIHWKENRGLLTNEKIVHLPKGPFLDNFDPIVGFLKEDGWVIENWVKPGSYKHKRVEYRVTEKADPNISSDRLSAIRKAIEWSRGQTANGISDRSHNESRSWKEVGVGKAQDVYLDVLSEEEHQELLRETEKTERLLGDAIQLFESSQNGPR